MKQTFTKSLQFTTLLLAGLALVSGVLQWFLPFFTANSTVLPAVFVMLVLALLPALALFGLFFYTPPFLKNMLRQLQRPSGNKASLPLFSLALGGILFFSLLRNLRMQQLAIILLPNQRVVLLYVVLHKPIA